MNLDPFSFALAEIEYAFKNLAKNNFKTNTTEINQLVNNFGFEAERHLIKCLYSQVDFLDGRNINKDFYQIHYLNQDYNNFINKPNFVSLICNALECLIKEQKGVKINQLLTNLSKISKLSRVQEIAYGLSLLHSSNSELRDYARGFVKQKLPDFLRSYIDGNISGSSQNDGLHDIAVEILHLLLINLLNGHENQFNIGSEQIEAFMATLRKDFPSDRVPVVLAPLIYPYQGSYTKANSSVQESDGGSLPSSPGRSKGGIFNIGVGSKILYSPFDHPFDPIPVHKLITEVPAITKTMVDVSKLVMELGYSFCASMEDCQANLIQIGVHEITPASVARILGMMASTHTRLSDGIYLYTYSSTNETSWNDSRDKIDQATAWNTEIFVNAVKEVVPHFHWRDVVYELDQVGLIVKDKQGLKLIMQAISQGLESNTETFPVDFFYRSWNNSEEQLSWLESIVNNPDIFCFADYASRQVSTDILKLTPEDESDRKIHTWKSLDMIEALLKLSERGHYQRVQELFKFPLQYCRDILTLGLLQIKGSLTLLGQDLLATLLPHALSNNSNSLIVLQIAWHSQYHSNITRTIIMHSMAEWYMKDPNDQSRLSRILDIAQDLKALSLLLNCTPFGFIIDLACLASRREYLKLEKWLGEKIREHGETFIWALVSFMKRRCPQVVHLLSTAPPSTFGIGGSNNSKDLLGAPTPTPIPKSLQLPPEILNVVINSLQTFVATILQQSSGGPAAIQPAALTAHPLLKSHQSSSSNPNFLYGSTSSGRNSSQPGQGSTPPVNLSSELCEILGTLLIGMAPSRSQKQQLATILAQQQAMVAGVAPVHNPPNHGDRLNVNVNSGHMSNIGNNMMPAPIVPFSNAMLHPQRLGQLAAAQHPGNFLDNSSSHYNMTNQQQSQSQHGSKLAQHLGSAPLPPNSVSSVSALMDLLNNMGVGGGSEHGNAFHNPQQSVTDNAGNKISNLLQHQQSWPPALTHNNNNNVGSNSGGGNNSVHQPAQMGSGPTSTMDMATAFSFDALARAMGANLNTADNNQSVVNKAQQQQQFNSNPSQAPNQASLATQSTNTSQPNLLSVDLSAMFPDMNMLSFGKDIEDEANAYFQRIYNRPPHPTMCLDEFISMLKRFRDSPEKREREVFACMLRNLFEEYRFFSTYPEKELHITSCLFGGLIEKGICNYVGLGIALRFVLEALRKPKEDKMRFFGITALDTFKERLKDYTQYCLHISQIPHFSEFPPYLREYVECGTRGQEVSASNKVSAPNPSKSFTPPPQAPQISTANANTATSSSVLSQPSSSASTLNKLTGSLATSLKQSAFDGDGSQGAAEPKEEVHVPAENVQDKLAFIFNNLSQANINQKTEEVMELMTDENLPWVSRYLVMKRASIENNFHNLYANFLECIRIPRLNTLVIQETFRNIKVLMKSDKAAGNFSDRSLLKNLGHWLGLLTIAKNKPLLQSEIDIKQLILEAAVKGTQELLYGIPFVAKILESCSRSKVFKPPNPWTMAIMNLLAEIHKEPEMKLNLKFEIEMLCKTLNLDINCLGMDTDILSRYRTKLLASTEQQLQHVAATPSSQEESSVPKTLQQQQPPTLLPQPQQTASSRVSAAALAGIPPPVPSAAAAAAANFFNMIMMQQQQQQQQQHVSSSVASDSNNAGPVPQQQQQQQQILANLLSNLSAPGNNNNTGSRVGPTPHANFAAAAQFQQQLQQMIAAAAAAAAQNQQGPNNASSFKKATAHGTTGGMGSTSAIATSEPLAGTQAYNSASSTPHPPSGTGSSVPQPQFQFHYNDINVSSGFGGILPYIQINSQIPLFQIRPQLRQLVRLALERSIQEILPPLAERVLKITLASAESLIKKDFALDPEEGRMRAAAHHLVRFLAGGISLYTVREPLFASLLTNFKSAFTIGLRGTSSLAMPSSNSAQTSGANFGSNFSTSANILSGSNNDGTSGSGQVHNKSSSGNEFGGTGASSHVDGASTSDRDSKDINHTMENRDVKDINHLVEHAANCLAIDNFELACCFAQKTTIERAVIEIDRRLGPSEYDIRKLSKAEHRRYCDSLVLTYQAERLPEQIRLKMGGVTSNQAMVYEVFSRNIPGFVANSAPRDLSLGAFGNLATTMLPPSFYPKLHPNNNGMGNSRTGFEGGPGSMNSQATSSGIMSGDDLQARIFDKLANELEQGLISLGTAAASLGTIPPNVSNDIGASTANDRGTPPTQPGSNNTLLAPLLRSLLEISMLARNVSSNPATSENGTSVVQSLVNKCMDGLFESCNFSQLISSPEIGDLANKVRDAHILVLKAIQDPRTFGPQWANKHITRYLIETKEESRFNLDAITCLITNRLVNIQQYDTYLSQTMENGLNYVAVTFSMQLVKRFCLDERDAFPLSESDFYKTIDALIAVSAHSRQAPEDLPALIEMIRNETDINLLDRGPALYSAMFHSGISAAKEFDDPPGLQDKVEFLFREWLNIYNSPNLSKDFNSAINTFMMQMHQQGIFKTDDLITRFFRICTEVCVEACYRTLQSSIESGGSGSDLLEDRIRQDSDRSKCYQHVDAYVKLISLLIKHSNQSENNGTQVNLLNKVLGIFVGLLVQHHKNPSSGNVFLPLPFHRLFAILYSEIIGMSSIFDSHSVQIVTAFCNAYHVLRPSELPGFCYSWLELIAHRNFIAKTLAYAPQSKVWNHYSELMTDIFKFLAPFLRNVDLPKSLLHFYNGCLRLLLVLLHDFPEFLCDFHYGFCDVIPPNCVQMRNLVLSAFPRSMRLPDPFTPNLNVDLLPEITQSPRVTTNFGAVISEMAPDFKNCMDTYLKTRSPVNFLTDLRSNLQENPSPGSHYNISLLNALVLYVGTSAITSIQDIGQTPGLTTITHSSHMDIFQNLAVGLDTEGRYLFLNAIANQLRYPNSHTHYFSCILLHLFGEANTEAIQEQITRVLLERLIVNRPHPWGLLITFIELIKNSSFHFWDHDFVRCAPEIEKLFDSVSKSCMQSKPPSQQHHMRDGTSDLLCDIGGSSADGTYAYNPSSVSMTNLSLGN